MPWPPPTRRRSCRTRSRRSVGRGHDPADRRKRRYGVNISEKDNRDRFPLRKHPRMRYYDYATPNYYFITICTHGKACIFGGPGRLNRRGRIAQQGILSITQHFPDAIVDKYVVMPNHIHAIIVLKTKGAKLTDVVGLYKSYVSREIHRVEPECIVWQTSFHDHVIRNAGSYERIWHYIDSNPAIWQEDCFYSE